MHGCGGLESWSTHGWPNVAKAVGLYMLHTSTGMSYMNLRDCAALVLQIELDVAQRERVPIRVQPSPALGRRGATNTPGAAMAAAQELEQVGRGCLGHISYSMHACVPLLAARVSRGRGCGTRAVSWLCERKGKSERKAPDNSACARVAPASLAPRVCRFAHVNPWQQVLSPFAVLTLPSNEAARLLLTPPPFAPQELLSTPTTQPGARSRGLGRPAPLLPLHLPHSPAASPGPSPGDSLGSPWRLSSESALPSLAQREPVLD